jgi:hypothetical protein
MNNCPKALAALTQNFKDGVRLFFCKDNGWSTLWRLFTRNDGRIQGFPSYFHKYNAKLFGSDNITVAILYAGLEPQIFRSFPFGITVLRFQ